MSTDAARELIPKIPKCELHVHLEGTLEPSLARKLASRNGLPIPADIGGGGDGEGYPFHDLTSFLKVYYAAMACLITKEDFADLVYAYLEKAHAQNVIHAEMFFDPQAHTSRSVAFETVIAGLVQGVARAKETFAISAQLIMCFLRDHSAESAQQTLDSLLASPHLQHVIGVGLDSDEAENPPRKFATVYAAAKAAGLRTTMHCDVDQANSIEHIRQALHEIGVERLDHGTNIIEDPKLVAHVVEKGIGLTCCPVSNSVVCSDFKGREIGDLLHAGVKVTVNSDDPAYFRGYMNENLEKMLEGEGMGVEELVRMQRNALQIAWIGEVERAEMLARLDAFVKANKMV